MRSSALSTLGLSSRLQITELENIFNGEHKFTISDDPPKKIPGAGKSVQAISDDVSVIYHVSKFPNRICETVDVAWKGKGGMIFTVINGGVTCLERIGLPIKNNPKLSEDETEALFRFMEGLHNFFD